MKRLAITCLILCAIVNTLTADESIVFGDLSLDYNATYNGKQAIKVTAPVTINNQVGKTLKCELNIFDGKSDYVNSKVPEYSGYKGHYQSEFTFVPPYKKSEYNNLYFYILFDNVDWPDGDVHLFIKISDPDTYSPSEVIISKDFNACKILASRSSSPTVASASAPTKTNTSESSSTSSNDAASQNSSSKSGLRVGYYYYESELTGEVALASVGITDKRCGSQWSFNGFGNLFIYAGRDGNRYKWQTYTFQPEYERRYNSFTGRYFNFATGKVKLVLTNTAVIFTSIDMKKVYTISGDYNAISRDEWLARNNSSTAPANSPGTQTTSPSSPTYEYHNIQHSGYVQCRHCHGTGRCSTCNGTGDRGDTHNHEPGKMVWKCTTCSGSGRCMFCNGTGRIRN